jgi:hypothetical protein
MERLSRLPLHADRFYQLRLIYERIELAFWYSVIPLLDETHPFGACVQHVYESLTGEDWTKVTRKAVLSAAAGIVLGVFLGILLKLAQQ